MTISDSEKSEKNEAHGPSGSFTSQRWLEVLLVFLVFFVAGGAPVPHVNETHYLAKAKHYWNPDWCAGDLFLESADAHLTFYWTLGLSTKWFTLPTAAWVGRLIAWALLAWSWQRLAAAVVQKPFVSVLGAMLFVWLVEQSNFAGEWVIGGIESKCIAYGFVFWAMAELANSRWQRVWPLLGVASAFHVLVGGWSVLAALAVWSCEPRNVRQPLLKMLSALMLGGILSLPGLVPGLMLTANAPNEVASEANQIYVFERLPHHLAPLTMPFTELTRKVLRFGALVLVYGLLWWTIRRGNAVQSKSTENKALVRIMRFGWASLLIWALGMLWHIAAWNHPPVAASLLKFYWFRLADVAVPVGVALAACALLTEIHLQKARLAVWCGILVFLLPSWNLVTASTNRWFDNTPPADSKLRRPSDWIEACRWIRKHTPVDATFAIPRMAQSFKWYAHRADLCNWKDVPQDAASMVLWWQRYRDLFTYIDEFGNRVYYATLGDLGIARIRELADEYSFDYVVAKQYPPLQLPTIYSNAGYTVYQLKASQGDAHLTEGQPNPNE